MFVRSVKGAERALEQGNETSDVLYGLAEDNVMQGNKAGAYKWLQKAIDAGWRNYRWAEIDPLLENMRNEDRFKQMIADVKAKVDEMRKRAEEMEKQ